MQGRFNGFFSKRRALLIGINYTDSQSFLHPALKCCHKDVLETKAFLQERGFREDNIKVLIDDGNSTEPTTSNILDALKWLVKNTGRKDTLRGPRQTQAAFVGHSCNPSNSILRLAGKVTCPSTGVTHKVIVTGAPLDQWIRTDFATNVATNDIATNVRAQGATRPNYTRTCASIHTRAPRFTPARLDSHPHASIHTRTPRFTPAGEKEREADYATISQEVFYENVFGVLKSGSQVKRLRGCRGGLEGV
eukprot:1190395-Prorocentrum_minimum.AAC.6